jgi:integrase
MMNPKHTIRRNNILIYRRRWPQGVQAVAGGQFFQRSLATGDARLAEKRIHEWRLPFHFDEAVEAFRHALGTESQEADAVSVASAIKAVISKFKPALREAEASLTHSILPLERVAYEKTVRARAIEIFKTLTFKSTAQSEAYLDDFIANPEAVRAAARRTHLAQRLLKPDLLKPSGIDAAIAMQLLHDAKLETKAESDAHKAASNIVERGINAIAKLFLSRLNGDHSAVVDDIYFKDYMQEEANTPSTQPAEDKKSARTLSWLIDQYRKQKIDKWPISTLKDFDYTMNLLKEYFGVNRSLIEIEPNDCLEFRDIIRALPANHSKKREFAGLTMMEVSKKAFDLGVNGRKPQTLKKQMGEVHRLFKYAEDFRFIDVSPARRIAQDIYDEVDSRDKRLPLTDNDIFVIMASDAIQDVIGSGLQIDWLNVEAGTAAKFWLLLILITTGMRLGEACQLHLTDICLADDGTYYFSLMPSGSTSSDDQKPELLNAQKRFKSKASRRQVPISADLIGFGLLDYIRIQQARGATLMQEHFKKNKYEKYDSASKWIIRHFEKIGISTNKASAHGLRHSMKDRLEAQGVSFKSLCDFQGWSRNSTVARNYGGRTPIGQLANEVSELISVPKPTASSKDISA